MLLGEQMAGGKKMDSAKEIITELPLQKLWSEKGALNARRVSYLSAADIMEMIKAGATFVVADVGQPPR